MMYEQKFEQAAVNFTSRSADPRLTELRRKTEARLDVKRLFVMGNRLQGRNQLA